MNQFKDNIKLMSEILNLEETANLILKKISLLLENLSSNLSKEKTENALEEGYGYIKEIENVINSMEKSNNRNNINLYMIKGELIKKKEKFENIQKAYILNKSNMLIDSLSTNNLIEDENNLDSSEINDEYDINDIYNCEENNNDVDASYGKNIIDEYFKENKNLIELKEGYLYNDNHFFQIKRLLYKIFLEVYKTTKEIPPKIKYLIILFLLMILLILCIVKLYFSIINYAK